MNSNLLFPWLIKTKRPTLIKMSTMQRTSQKQTTGVSIKKRNLFVRRTRNNEATND